MRAGKAGAENVRALRLRWKCLEMCYGFRERLQVERLLPVGRKSNEISRGGDARGVPAGQTKEHL